MNYTTQSHLSRRTSLAAALALALGASIAVAQSSGTSTAGSSTNTDRQTTGGTRSSTSGSTYGTQTDSSRRDADTRRDRSTSDVNATYDSGVPSGRNVGTTKTAGVAADRDSDYNTSRDKLSFGDRRFMTKAADSSTTEVAMAQLAQERASNPEVRRFAEKIVQDHSGVNSELTRLASSKNLKLDDEEAKDRHYRRLAKRSGVEFDREFLEHMVEMHEKDVKDFEKAARDAKDPEVRAFASKHVEHLRNHLQQAQNLRSSVMPTGRTDDEDQDPRREDTSSTQRTDKNYDRSESTFGTGAAPSASGTTDYSGSNNTSGSRTDSGSASGSGSDTTRRSGSGR